MKHASGKTEKITKKLSIEIKPPLHFVESKIKLPETDDSGFLYEFIDPMNQGEGIAYLRVDHMQGFREDKEMQNNSGSQNYSDDELNTFPSATECFRNLVLDMKNKNMQNLIIDLRKNGGGNSRMASILVYFLYGKDVLNSIPMEIAKSGGGHGNRLSPLYFKTHTKLTIDNINENRSIPLQVGDIDFGYYLNDLDNINMDSLKLKQYESSPTFYEEFKSCQYSNYYCPKNVIVLMTPWTSS